MQNAAVLEIDPIVEPFPLAPEPRISNFERGILCAWAHGSLPAKRAYLMGMCRAYLDEEGLENIDDLIFLERFCLAQEAEYTGPERRRAFYPLSRLQIAGSLLADIAANPEQYDATERAQRIADWNSISAATWNAGPELLRFCEKRV